MIETDANTKNNLEKEIASLKIKSRIFYLLIVISGIFKFYLFYDAYMTFNTITIAVFVCYMLGSILHISYTGYFFYTSIFNFKIQKEFKEHRLSNGQKHHFNGANLQPMEADIANPNPNLIETTAGLHSITKNGNGQFELKTSGVLLDKELAALVAFQQGSTAQGIVARTALRRQLTILYASN